MNTEEKIGSIFRKAEGMMIDLYFRWQDEKEYEDIQDYAKVMEKLISESGGSFVKVYKKPFGCTLRVDGELFQLSVNKNLYELKVL